MKGDTVLDYVEFQLTPPRTRCELYVSAHGVTEKLASGFLKPFLTHLKAAEEQNARGFQSIRLEHPQAAKDQHGKTWFTKGTLERFVRFVSTPEVLERVKTIEDELAQLEQVRNIQANSLLQTDDFYLGLDSNFPKPDGKVPFGVQENLKQPRRFQYDVDTGGEASKVELLRAMDVRLLALQQEQIMGFARAAAAGFDSRNMADLMAFSEYFGAERLCTACVHFLTLSEKRQGPKQGIGDIGLNRDIERSSPLMAGFSKAFADQVCSNFATRGFVMGEDKQAFHQEVGVTSSTLNKDQGSTEARRRWGPPESLRPKVFTSKNEVDLASSEDTSEDKLQNDSPSTHSLRQKHYSKKIEKNDSSSKLSHRMDDSELNSTDTSQAAEHLQSIESNCSSFSVDKSYVQGLAEKQKNNDCGLSYVSMHPPPLKLLGSCMQVNHSLATVPDGRTNAAPYKDLQIQVDLSTDAQCSSSLKKQPPAGCVGRSGGHHSDGVMIQGVNCFSSQDGSTNETNFSACEHSSVGSDSFCNDSKADELPPSLVPLSQPARRLSVQDAISLFESKQHKHSIETQQKQWQGKPESTRASLEASSSSLSSRSASRSWSAGTSIGVINGAQERVISGKQSQVLHHEVAPVAASTSLNLKLPQEMQDQSTVEPTQSASGDCSSQTWKPPTQSSQIDTANSHARLDNTSSCGDGERQKQFKVQLEKGLVIKQDTASLKKSQNSDPTEVEMNTARKAGTQIVDTSCTHSDPKSASSKGQTFWTEALVSADLQQYQLPQIKTYEVALGVGNNNQVHIVQEDSELRTPFWDSFPNEGHSACVPFRAVSPNGSGNRESLDSSRVLPLDCDMQALFKIVGSQNEEADSPSGMEGRFYEHYMKLREAKLSEEQDSKRAEREAKLKFMEETLKRRKAEMDARPARLPKNNHVHQDRAPSQQQLPKAELNPLKKEQEDGDKGLQSLDKGLELPMHQKTLTSSSASPPLTPKTVKEQVPFLKAQTGKKATSVLPKTATTPRTSTRAAVSVSPKSTPRSAAGIPLAHRRSAAFTTNENPLTRSVPSFANLRKENTKPSPGRSFASTHGHSKGGGPGFGRLGALCEGAPSETNLNTSVHSASRNALQKEDRKKHRSAAIRNSLASASELKTLLSGNDGVLAPRGQKDGVVSDLTIHNRSRWSTVNPSHQESKPFLRKGRGIGPGAGPVVMKHKVSSSVVDATKNSDEDEIFMAGTGNSNANNDCVHEGVLVTHGDSDARVANEKALTADDSTDMDALKLEMEINVDHSPAERDSQHVYQEDDPEITNVDVLPNVLLENGRDCSTVSLPINIETKKRYAVSELVLGSHSCVEGSCSRQEDDDALSQVPFHDALEPLPNGTIAEKSALLFRASSLPDELMLPHALSPVAASPSGSAVTRPPTLYDRTSPSSGVNLESPSGSPASWSSPQIQYASEADSSRMNKKWAGFQKPATLGPPKGFKRLLNFARKGRASEIASTDCVSASTTSEGDDEWEEAGCSAGDVARRAGVQERRPCDHGTPSMGDDEQANLEVHQQAPPSAVSVRSSIPAPPVNFRLRDDHLGGGTMLKAPRSFFSLSSFRSRGSEGKAR